MNTRKFFVLFSILTLSAMAQAAVPIPRQIGPNATLTFEIDRAALTRDSKSRLDTLAEDANDQGGINEVQVAAWSDNPTPLANEKPSVADRDLARNRAAAIGNYLKARCKVNVNAYNMAERSGGNVRAPKEEYQILMNGGQRSRAVALVIWKRPAS